MSRKSQGNDSRDNTRNETQYLVRYTYQLPGTARRTWDFNTRDKAQAYRKAKKYAQQGCLIGLYRHNGAGQWTDLTVTAANEEPTE